MSERDKTEALVVALAETIRLEIPKDALPGVVAFFSAAEGHAAALEKVNLNDATLDLAPVFRLPAEGDDGA